MSIKGRKILLGITGGIALYKVLDLCSKLKKNNVDISIIMTRNATKFISPMTFETMGQCIVYSDMFHDGHHDTVEHISLVKNIDAFLICPATANILAKAASGIADDLLSSALLAYEGKPIFAPSMNTYMLQNQATQSNIEILKERGCSFISSQKGFLACGDIGDGRMADVDDILFFLEEYFSVKDLLGKNIIVTAGPTIERLDPVRYMTNESSGKMGYAIAERAHARGAHVELISGPGKIKPRIPATYIESAHEMKEAIESKFSQCDALIMAAAPCDFSPLSVSKQKIKKVSGSEPVVFEFKKNDDIIKYFSENSIGKKMIGFAAETDHLIDNAKKKLKEKKVDYIIANDVSQKEAGFNVDTNKITIIGKDFEKSYPILSKYEVADIILDLIKE